MDGDHPQTQLHNPSSFSFPEPTTPASVLPIPHDSIIFQHNQEPGGPHSPTEPVPRGSGPSQLQVPMPGLDPKACMVWWNERYSWYSLAGSFRDGLLMNL